MSNSTVRAYLHDQLDQQLISLLREDGRASVSTLSKQLKVSRGTVQNRIERLAVSYTHLTLPTSDLV